MPQQIFTDDQRLHFPVLAAISEALAIQELGDQGAVLVGSIVRQLHRYNILRQVDGYVLSSNELPDSVRYLDFTVKDKPSMNVITTAFENVWIEISGRNGTNQLENFGLRVLGSKESQNGDVLEIRVGYGILDLDEFTVPKKIGDMTVTISGGEARNGLSQEFHTDCCEYPETIELPEDHFFAGGNIWLMSLDHTIVEKIVTARKRDMNDLATLGEMIKRHGQISSLDLRRIGTAITRERKQPGMNVGLLDGKYNQFLFSAGVKKGKPPRRPSTGSTIRSR